MKENMEFLMQICDTIWDEKRSWWWAILIFTFAAVWLSWSMLPLSVFEAILDPIILVLEIRYTIKKLRNR